MDEIQKELKFVRSPINAQKKKKKKERIKKRTPHRIKIDTNHTKKIESRRESA